MASSLLKRGLSPTIKMLHRPPRSLFLSPNSFAPPRSVGMASQPAKQSPVDLTRTSSVFDAGLKGHPIKVDYHDEELDRIDMGANGYTWTVHLKEGAKSEMTGVHLGDRRYRLVQFHGHWGNHTEDGSEHDVNGKAFGAELHFVHLCDKYKSVAEAAGDPHGLAVLGVFLEVRKDDNPHLEPILKHIPELKKRGKIPLQPKEVLFSELIPASKLLHYWTYDGSLTTPPYTECVLWTVLRDTEPISMRQIEVLRQFAPRNVRDCFPLNGRVVRRSFE